MANIDLNVTFTQTPASMKKDRRICGDAKLLYGDIAYLCREEGGCWASTKHLASVYGVSTRTIENWLTQLERYGYITRTMSENPYTGRTERLIIAADIELLQKQSERNQPSNTCTDLRNDSQQDAEPSATSCGAYSNTNNSSNNNSFNISYIKNIRKIQDSGGNVKSKFKNYDQREYTENFYTEMLEQMCRGDTG